MSSDQTTSSIEKTLAGRVCLVTGSTRGIGRAIAKEFGRWGATVVINGRRKDGELEKTHAEVLEVSGGCERAIFDVQNLPEVQKGILEVAERVGPIAVLVNCAGVTGDNLFARMDLGEFERVIKTNLLGSVNCAQAVLRGMSRAKWGRIINISSVVGHTGNPGQTSYCASKSAIEGFSRALAKEYAGRNITVNCVAPGFIDTAMTAALRTLHKEVV